MSIPSAAEFKTVRYPAEAKFAAVHAAVDRGTVLIRAAAGGAVLTDEGKPLSPVYHLTNAACGRNLILPLGVQDGVPEVAAVTAVNDSDQPATLSVVVGVSHLPAVNQSALQFSANLAANGGSAFVHIAFHKLD